MIFFFFFFIPLESRPEETYHVLSGALPGAFPLRAAASLLVKLAPLGHQAHTQQLVHNACSRALGRELLHDVTQNICVNTSTLKSFTGQSRIPDRSRHRKQAEGNQTVCTVMTTKPPNTIRVSVLLKQHLQLQFLLLGPQNDLSALPLKKKIIKKAF